MLLRGFVHQYHYLYFLKVYRMSITAKIFYMHIHQPMFMFALFRVVS